MEVLFESAFEIAKAIKNKTISSKEVINFYLDRIERINPEVNAVVQVDAERALSRAHIADEAVRSGQDCGPLHGVPLTIKDAYLTEGIVSANGLPHLKNNIPDRNADVVQKYIDAGAIILGKTNTPLASGDFQSFNDIYGTTNNPWDITRTCGGSSGGAAAALASGMTPLELGGDIGGSIRIPSHLNGVYGHKPSHGIVSQRSLVDWPEQISEQDLWVVGPMGICARDIRDALRILIGPVPEKAPAWNIQLPSPRCTDIKKLRVATCFDQPNYPIDHEVKAELEAVADSLEKEGALVVREVAPDIDFQENLAVYLQIMYSHMDASVPEEMKQAMAKALAPIPMSEDIIAMFGASVAQWNKVNERRFQLQRKWMEFFQNYDILLAPILPLPAFEHDHTPIAFRRWQVNGEDRSAMLDTLFWASFSLLTYLPATAVPAGQTKTDKLPVGVQIVGPYLEDETPLEVAAMLEQCHRSFEPAPNYKSLNA